MKQCRKDLKGAVEIRRIDSRKRGRRNEEQSRHRALRMLRADASILIHTVVCRASDEMNINRCSNINRNRK